MVIERAMGEVSERAFAGIDYVDSIGSAQARHIVVPCLLGFIKLMMFKVQRANDVSGGITIVDGDRNPVEPVGQFLTYLSVRGYSPNTISAYAYDLTHLWNFLSSKGWTWDSLSVGSAVEFFVHLRSAQSKRKGCDGTLRLVADLGASVPARLSSATINRVMVVVSSFYDWAILTGAFAGLNPIKKVEDRTARFVSDHHHPFLTGISRRSPEIRELRVKMVQRLPRPMNDTQIAKLFDALCNLRDKSLVMLMLNAGLRPGEALGLHLADIAYGRRRIIVRCRDDHPKGVRSKSRSERVVDLHDGATLSTLSSYVMTERPREATSPFVFLVGGNGKNKAEHCLMRRWFVSLPEHVNERVYASPGSRLTPCGTPTQPRCGKPECES